MKSYEKNFQNTKNTKPVELLVSQNSDSTVTYDINEEFNENSKKESIRFVSRQMNSFLYHL
jgi:hypothetical protein